MNTRILRVVTTTHEVPGGGWTVWRKVSYIESTLASGTVRTHTESFERLSRAELTDVLEILADGPVPGEPFHQVLEQQLF